MGPLSDLGEHLDLVVFEAMILVAGGPRIR